MFLVRLVVTVVVVLMSVLAQCGLALAQCDETNQAPIWLSQPPGPAVTVTEGRAVRLQLPFARDPEGGPVRYEVLYRPPLSIFDEGTHEFSWIPGYSLPNGRPHVGSNGQPTGLPGDAFFYLSAFDSCERESRIGLYFEIKEQTRAIRRVAPPMRSSTASQRFPVFPLGMPRFLGGRDMLRYARDLGFTAVATQGIGISIDREFPVGHPLRSSEIEGAISALKGYLDSAHQYGLQVIVAAHQPEIVAAIREKPAILAYELPDEPDYYLMADSSRYMDPYYSPENYRAMADAIRAIDPARLVMANFSARFSQLARPAFIAGELLSSSVQSEITEGYRSYIAALDVISFDYYLQSGSATPCVTADSRLLSGIVEELRDLAQDTKPVIAIIEANNANWGIPASQQSPPNCPITPQDIRNQSSAVLEGGAAAIGFYATNQVPGYVAWDIHPDIEAAFPDINGSIADTSVSLRLYGDGSPNYPRVLSVLIDPLPLGERLGRVIWETPGPRKETCELAQLGDVCLERVIEFGSPEPEPIRVTLVEQDKTSIVLEALIDPDLADYCPLDPLKQEPGQCGCGVRDQDVDGDGLPDCADGCPLDRTKVAPGSCGCGVAETDSNQDGRPDCMGTAEPSDPSAPNEPLNPGELEVKCNMRGVILDFPYIAGAHHEIVVFKQGDRKKPRTRTTDKTEMRLKSRRAGTWVLRYTAEVPGQGRGASIDVRIRFAKVRSQKTNGGHRYRCPMRPSRD